MAAATLLVVVFNRSLVVVATSRQFALVNKNWLEEVSFRSVSFWSRWWSLLLVGLTPMVSSKILLA
jgi:hypothetical protein